VTFVTDGTPHPAMSMSAIIAAARIVADTCSIKPLIGLETRSILVNPTAIEFTSAMLQ
jgi:hypothetical protein